MFLVQLRKLLPSLGNLLVKRQTLLVKLSKTLLRSLFLCHLTLLQLSSDRGRTDIERATRRTLICYKVDDKDKLVRAARAAAGLSTDRVARGDSARWPADCAERHDCPIIRAVICCHSDRGRGPASGISRARHFISDIVEEVVRVLVWRIRRSMQRDFENVRIVVHVTDSLKPCKRPVDKACHTTLLENNTAGDTIELNTCDIGSLTTVELNDKVRRFPLFREVVMLHHRLVVKPVHSAFRVICLPHAEPNLGVPFSVNLD